MVLEDCLDVLMLWVWALLGLMDFEDLNAVRNTAQKGLIKCHRVLEVSYEVLRLWVQSWWILKFNTQMKTLKEAKKWLSGVWQNNSMSWRTSRNFWGYGFDTYKARGSLILRRRLKGVHVPLVRWLVQILPVFNPGVMKYRSYHYISLLH